MFNFKGRSTEIAYLAISRAVLVLAIIAQEFAFIFRFGFSREAEIYLLVSSIFLFVPAAFVQSYPTSIIAIYSQVKNKEGKVRANTLILTLSILVALLGLVISLVIENILSIFASSYLRITFTGGNDIVSQLVIVFLPVMALQMFTSALGGFLVVHEKTYWTVLVRLVTPFVQAIIFILSPSVLLAGAGLIIGAFIELIITIGLIGRINLKWQELNIRNSVHDALNPLLQIFWLGSTSLFGGAAAMVDQLVASTIANPGNIATLNYSYKAVNYPMSFVGYMIGIYTIRQLTQLNGKRNLINLQIILQKIHLIAIIVFVSLSLLSFIFIVATIGNSLSNPSIPQVAAAYGAYAALSIPIVIMIRFYVFINRSQVVLYGYILSFLVSSILDFALAPYLGIVGIALSTSIAALCLYFAFYRDLKKKLKNIPAIQ